METDEINVDDVTLKCNKCKQSYTEKNDLMEHRKTQHPETNKSCNLFEIGLVNVTEEQMIAGLLIHLKLNK